MNLDNAYAPLTGFGDDYRTSAKFTLMQPEDTWPEWVSEPILSNHPVSGSHTVNTQQHGRRPWSLSVTLRFATITELDRFDALVGRRATLRYLYGISKRAGGTRWAHDGYNYLILPETLLSSIDNERLFNDGHCEARVTFERLFVPRPAYVEPEWPDHVTVYGFGLGPFGEEPFGNTLG